MINKNRLLNTSDSRKRKKREILVVTVLSSPTPRTGASAGIDS